MTTFYEKLAKIAVHYSLEVKPKQTVAIQSPTIAKEICLALYKEILLAGGYPTMNLGFPGQNELFFLNANDDQLKYVSELGKIVFEKFDHIIVVNATSNSRALEQIDPKKKQLQNSNPERAEIMKTFMRRLGTKEMHYLLLPYPCHSKAQDAGYGIYGYTEFVTKALALDQEDPMAYWKKVQTDQDRLVKILNEVDKIEVYGEDTELSLSVKGRTWVNCSGQLNLPDGEVYTGPIEDSINGHIRFTYPGIFQGQEIENIYLEIKDGKVTKATASKGQELLDSILEIEGADGFGEFAIGTNYNITKFTKNMLFDEKIGGTMHMALGMGIAESGSLAKSAIHWDILKDMKSDDSRIVADGKVIYQAGKWLI
jgi:aminopeptidase